MPHSGTGDAQGKLKAVARAWASGRGGKPERADDVASQNAKLPEWMERSEIETVELPKADADVASLFLALDTQWRHHAMTGHRMGLDYSAIKPTAEMFEIPVDRSMMHDLRIMEIAALNEMAKDSQT